MTFKNKLFIILFLLIFPNFVFSQSIEEKFTQFGNAFAEKRFEDALKFENDIYNYSKINYNDTNFLEILNYLIVLNYSLENYDKSILLSNESLDLTKKKYGENSLNYCNNLLYLVIAYLEKKEYDKCIYLEKDCLKKLDFLRQNQTSFYLRNLENLAFSYQSIQDYENSIDTYKKCIELSNKITGDNSEEYLINLMNLAECYSYAKYYKQSLELSILCLEKIEKLLGKENPGYLISLGTLANNYSGLGNFYQALELNIESVRLSKKIFGEDNPGYLISLGTLANNYSDLGNFTKALELNIECTRLSKKNLGEENLNYLSALSNLALNYSDLGNFNKSLELNLESLKIQEKVFGKEYPNYLISLNNLASNYSELGNYSKALEINLECLKLRKKILGEENQDYLSSLNNLSQIYSELGNYTKSLELNIECVKLSKKILGEDNPYYLISLSNLSTTYFYLENHTKSLEINLECLKLKKKILGEENPDYLNSLNNLAHNYYKLKNYTISDSLFQLTSKLKFIEFKKNLIGLNENLKESLKKEVNVNYQMFSNYSIFRKEANPILLANSFNYWLNLNGIVSDQSTQLQEKAYASQDTSYIQLYEDWKLNKLQLMKYYELTSIEREEKGINIKEAEETVNHQEQELSRRSDVFSDMKKEYSFSDIQNNLKEDEAFVDIVRLSDYDKYNISKSTDTLRYLVYVITKETKEHPKYVVIENGNLLEEEILPSYSENTFGANKNQKEADKNSYNYFWKPISEQINGKKKVFVSMGGVYNNINLQTLYNSATNKYLLDETDIQIVNNGRSFIQSRTKQATKYTDFTATLVGFPNYNGTLSTIKENDDIAYSRDLTPILMDSLARGGFSASSLPATKTEVETIGKTLKDKKWSVNVLTEDNATEDNIKSLNSPRVLHLATHGYFMKVQEVSKENNQRYMGMETQKVVENPLLRSGLLFAGANKTLKGDTTKVSENGILTAYEASYLNLKGTELVVLSACETGKGDIKNGEGVYGLRKSIADAGAKNIIMSLWKVDDKVTQEFMSTFYENWLTGTTIREAFTKTQNFIKDKYPQPYYWGAFVLIGE